MRLEQPKGFTQGASNEGEPTEGKGDALLRRHTPVAGFFETSSEVCVHGLEPHLKEHFFDGFFGWACLRALFSCDCRQWNGSHCVARSIFQRSFHGFL